MSSLLPNYSNFEMRESNMNAYVDYIRSISKENNNEEYLNSLCVDFIEAISSPIIKKDLSELMTKLKVQFNLVNNYHLKHIFVQILTTYEGRLQPAHLPKNFPSSAYDQMPTSPRYFSPFGTKDFWLVNIDNNLHNKLHLEILNILLCVCFHTKDQKLFELILKAHQKLNYPKLIYKYENDIDSYIELRLHLDIIQWAFSDEQKFHWLRSVSTDDLPSHLAEPCLCTVNTSGRSSFFQEKERSVSSFYLTPFCDILKDQNLLQNFFSKIPFETIQTLAD